MKEDSNFSFLNPRYKVKSSKDFSKPASALFADPLQIEKRNQFEEIIGAFTVQNKICVIVKDQNHQNRILESYNAKDFQIDQQNFPLPEGHVLQVGSLDLGRFIILRTPQGIATSLTAQDRHWNEFTLIPSLTAEGNIHSVAIIPQHYHEGKYVMLVGGSKIQIATSPDAKNWRIEFKEKYVIAPQDQVKYEIDLVKKVEKGFLLCYRKIFLADEDKPQEVHLALLDAQNPYHVLWHSSAKVWQAPTSWTGAKNGGTLLFRNQIISFWNIPHEKSLLVKYPLNQVPFQLPKDQMIELDRARTNPVIYPRPQYPWESFATYNPAAFHANGKVHILYRAQGHDLISSIGYANSSDGLHIDERLEKPVYLPQEVFESFQKSCASQVAQQFVSGGGIAGCEDPRVTLIGDTVYMTYVAFDGASPPRVALTSIALKDLEQKKWNWSKPRLISRPGIVDKSAVIFPEKINGQFVLMHRIFPHIQIDYRDNLDFQDRPWLEENDRISIRDKMWDSRKIGAGAPPLKTKDGWLLIYYGVDDRDDRRYKMGAMLLDLENPAKVLYRSSCPILEPEDWYENHGFKPGIVYPCGAVIVNQTLHVYYGGADCVVCVASRPLEEFIQSLKDNDHMHLNQDQEFIFEPFMNQKKFEIPTSNFQSLEVQSLES